MTPSGGSPETERGEGEGRGNSPFLAGATSSGFSPSLARSLLGRRGRGERGEGKRGGGEAEEGEGRSLGFLDTEGGFSGGFGGGS